MHLRTFVLILLLLLPAWAAAGYAPPLEPQDRDFRVGFSSQLFTDVNENDAKAATKGWGASLARERGIPTDPDVRIVRGVQELRAALRNQEVDAVTITAEEYSQVCKEFRFGPLFATNVGGKITEQYVLLVRIDSGLNGPEDLRGRSVLIHDNFRTSLAAPWLDTVLARQGLKPVADFAGSISRVLKLPRVVLPVYFRQADACLVTIRGFETMSELNPQLRQQLRVIATSPEFVPAVMAMRLDFRPVYRDRVIDGLRNLHASQSGRQLLMVFHSEKIEEQTPACLESALELLAQHARLGREAAGKPR